MDYVHYLRERAADFRNVGITARDSLVAQRLHEVALICEETARIIERNSSTGTKMPADALTSLGTETIC